MAAWGPSGAMDCTGARIPSQVDRQTVPAFARAMGHEEDWKLNDHCQPSKFAIYLGA